MDELRFVRREEHSLIVANDAGEEFALIVDESVLLELRHLSRRDRDAPKARPREIQALIRAGRSRAEVAKATGLAEADIERYEEPVLAERRYLLERAHAVPVRATAGEQNDQQFGEVISDRLVALGADASEWSSWRDPEAGWMIGLEFISHDVAHRAVWSFDHRKGLLSPTNPDAVNLSKQGDIGERLIPKLRAVDTGSRSANPEEATEAPSEEEPADELPAEPVEAPAPTAPVHDSNVEYERRREIDQRAISSDEPMSDMSQTADLLDALRKRRGARDRGRAGNGDAAQRAAEEAGHPSADAPQGAASAPEIIAPVDPEPSGPAQRGGAAEPEKQGPEAPRSIWGAAGVSSGATLKAVPSQPKQSADAPSAAPSPQQLDVPVETAAPAKDSRGGASSGASQSADRGNRKGRASIPSWDDILFGTRSDEDPA